MRYSIDVAGFDGGDVSVEIGGLFSVPKLYIGNELTPKGAKSGQFLLKRADGSDAIASFRKTSFIDPVPLLVIDGVSYKVVEPLKWYEWVWSGLPVTLVFVGGALGALFGITALLGNSRIFRSKLNPVMKYVWTAFLSIAAVVVYLVASVIFVAFINSVFDKPTELVSTAGRFSVTAPTRLSEQTQDITLPTSDIVKLHMFIGERNGVTYYVSYSDYPAQLIAQSEPANMLAGARDGAAQSTGGTIANDSEILLKGHRGRTFEVQNAKDGNKVATIHSRIFLVGNRLYQVFAVNPELNVDNVEIDRFLESFNLND